MKAIKFIYTLALGAALGLTSCGSDFLGTPTDSRVELDTTDKLRMLLVSSYPQNNYGWPCELMSDNMEDNNAPDADGLRYDLHAYDRGDDEMFAWETCVSNTNSDSPSAIWESHYHAIAGANAVLQEIAKLEQKGKLDATQSAIKGEALLIRSYCHFMLAQVFCHPYRGDALNESLLGIPYITKPETSVKPNYQRGTLKETYDAIRKDLEDGLPLIDNSLYEVPKYHFNKTAADAYAARFYLFTRDYDKCLEHCNKAFGGETVDPNIYMNTFFANIGNFYSFSDYGRFNQGSDKARNFMLIATYSIASRRMMGSRYGVIRDALNSTIYTSSPSWSSFKFKQSNGKGGTFTMHPCFNGCLYVNSKSEYGLIFPGNISEQFEITDKIAGIGYAHMTRSEFTGEEVLLTRAEAKLFKGDINGALADIDIWEKYHRNGQYIDDNDKSRFVDLTIDNIRSFYVDRDPGYGIAKPIHIDEVCPDTKYTISTPEEIAMLQCIQHFRRIEFIHTGMRWFDIKRLGLEFDRKIGKVRVEHLGIFDERKAIQIPAEIAAAGMQQNPRPDEKSFKRISPSELERVYE